MSTKNHYISLEAFRRLQQELNQLLKTERPNIVRAVTEAAAMGDRSENAEYIYGKKRLREIDRRVRFLQKRLSSAEIVEEVTQSLEKISFGLTAELLDENGKVHRYKIVGADDVSLKPGNITYNSPMGKALLGKSVGDEVLVKRPAGDLLLTVVRISRESSTTSE